MTMLICWCKVSVILTMITIFVQHPTMFTFANWRQTSLTKTIWSHSVINYKNWRSRPEAALDEKWKDHPSIAKHSDSSMYVYENPYTYIVEVKFIRTRGGDIIKVIIIHCLGTMNVCAKCYGNPSSRWDISLEMRIFMSASWCVKIIYISSNSF